MEIFEKWWDNGNKVVSIRNHRNTWKKCGIKPMFRIHENGARKKFGDRCFDLNIIIGYTCISYTNFNL